MANQFPGIFVTFEGTEGVGKSTLIREVSARLEEAFLPTLSTREPGGSQLAEKVRSLILHSEMDPLSELFLYEAARAHHVVHLIKPALLEGKIVLCDRFTDSTLAYQGHARGLDWENIKTLNQIASANLIPHLTFFLNLDPVIGLKRVQDPNRFEREGEDFHRQVYAGFLKIQAENPSRFHVLEVQGRNPTELSIEVVKILKERFSAFFQKARS